MKGLLISIFGWLLLFVPAQGKDLLPAGAARLEISPESPVQLINIKTPEESTQVAGKLFARALALGGDGEVVMLISFDGIGVPGSLAKSVADLLVERYSQLSRERIAICATHTHWAPHLTDLLGNIYGGPLPQDHQARVDAYTDILREKLIEVAENALKNRKPALVDWNKNGRVTFATNRRMEEGGQLLRDEEKGLMITWNPNAPVDHALPVLAVRDAETGKVLALHFTYACHNVAITGTTAISRFPNAVHGDWAGLTQEELESRYPDSVAMATIGCGGDQRPDFCGGEDVARAHAMEIADEIDRLLEAGEGWNRVEGVPKVAITETELPLSPVPTLDEMKSFAETESQNASTIARSFVARGLLQRIEQGKEPPSGVPFIAQSFDFPGEGPLWLFLSGEVCIDYQLRIKQEWGERLWPIAYANDTPCYIVSKRMLDKGGYEAGNSMFYYGWLRPLEPSAEDLVMDAVSRVINKE